MKTSLPLVTRRVAAKVLGVSLRTFSRAEEEGILTPARRGRGGRPSLYDLAAVVPAYRGHVERKGAGGETPRERRENAQAKLLELRFARETGEALNRADVIRSGQGVARALAAYFLAMPSQMVRAGAIPPKAEAAVDRYIRARLDELSRFESIGEDA